MFANWDKAMITDIMMAIYVAPGTGSTSHKDRPYHGLVLNDPDSAKDYLFSDGTILHTKGSELFYLPKYSTYKVKMIPPGNGGCYAINFDLKEPVSTVPFSLHFRNTDQLLRHFKEASRLWTQRPNFYQPEVTRHLYDIILLMGAEMQKNYLPNAHDLLIAPAVEQIRSRFTDNSLSVASLACLCGISEAYFRRLFFNKFGVSPKEYIIGLRINYAKELLRSGHFSVTDTAFLCGYGEPCHFSREFTKAAGISPAAYKRNAQYLPFGSKPPSE